MFIKKLKNGNTRKIIIFNFIKISYKKKKNLSTVKIKDYGENNFISYPKIHNSTSDGGVIRIKGNNNKIHIGEFVSFHNCHIELWGDNITFEIGKNSTLNGLHSIISGHPRENCILKIGDNFWNSENLQLFAGGGENMNLEIGNNCMFSRNIAIYAHDGHNILNFDGKIINTPNSSVEIGEHVWIGHGVNICKGTKISKNSIVGMGSLVNKKFEKENVIIAGNPAKIVKEGTNWEK